MTASSIRGFNHVDEIREANESAGHFFFRPDTMRFFKSRVLDGVYGGWYFVTSERGPDMPRRYTLRRADADGSVHTVGAHQAYATAAQAKAAAQAAAAGIIVG